MKRYSYGYAKTDRNGQEYVRVVDAKYRQLIAVESVGRQARKARGLSGRQEVKWRKERRRAARDILRAS